MLATAPRHGASPATGEVGPVPVPSALPGSFSARVIRKFEDLLPLGADWDRLLAASAEGTPWQGFDFMQHWWRELSAGLALRVVVVESAGKPCLILPLQVSRWPWLPGIPVRILEPIGSIMDVNRPRLGLGPDDMAAYDAAFAAVDSIKHDWHTIRIDEKRYGDFEVAALRRYARRTGFLFRQSFSHLCPYLDIDRNWSEYLAGRSQKLRKNLRAARRKLEGLGIVTVRTFEADRVPEGLDVVVALHARSWKRRKKVEHSQSDAYRSFFRGWLESMGRRNAARVLALYCGERPVAATIAFMDADTYYSAQIVHDQEFDACSPGTLLEAIELEELFNSRRYRHYHFLGSFLSNKLRWTDSAHETTHVFVLRPLLRTRLVSWYYFSFKPRVRPPLMRLIGRLRGRP